jgi:hypothetical protein
VVLTTNYNFKLKKTTMKKFLAIAMIAATLTSCGGGETKEEATTDSAALAPVETPAPAADSMAKPAMDSMATPAADTTKKP